jgi:hypothetical protein
MTMANDSKVEIKIPEQLIDDLVRAEMVSHLSNAPQIVEKVVKAAMEAKTNSYDRETVFHKMVSKMIREEACDVFKAWVDENRPLIKEAMLRHLNNNRQRRLRQLVEAMAKGMSNFRLNMRVSWVDENE